MAHPREMHLFNEFMREHPRPTAKTWDELAALFKFKSDYETIFPKLPSMLRNYYNKWKVTQELTMLKDTVKTDYYGLLKKLGKPSRDTDNVAAEFQKNRSDAQIEEPLVDLGESVAEAAIADLPLNPMPFLCRGRFGLHFGPKRMLGSKDRLLSLVCSSFFSIPFFVLYCSYFYL